MDKQLSGSEIVLESKISKKTTYFKRCLSGCLKLGRQIFIGRKDVGISTLYCYDNKGIERREMIKGGLTLLPLTLLYFRFRRYSKTDVDLSGLEFNDDIKENNPKTNSEQINPDNALEKNTNDFSTKKIIYDNLGLITGIGQSMLLLNKDLVYKFGESIESLILSKSVDNSVSFGTKSYIDTLNSALVMSGINILFSVAQLGLIGTQVHIGNAGTSSSTGPTGSNKKQKNSYIEKLILSSVVSPIIEEVIFRGFLKGMIDHLIQDSTDERTKSYGTYISSLVFAYFHNIVGDKFDKSYFPLYQFIGGMYYAYLKDNRGLTHSMLAHSFENFLVVV